MRAIAITLIGLFVASSRGSAQPSEQGSISTEQSNVWALLETQCGELATKTGEEIEELRTKRKASAPIVDYCTTGVYPAFFAADGTLDQDAFKIAFQAVGGPANGVTTAVTTNGPVPALGGIGDTLIQGLAAVLIKRAKAELQGFVVTTIRDRVCANAKVKRFVENTCAYVGDESEAFGVTLGPALRAAVVSDVVNLPNHALALLDKVGTAPALGARLVIETAVTLVERTDVKSLANRFAILADGWVCKTGDNDCETLKTAVEQTSKILLVAVDVADALNAATDSKTLTQDKLKNLAELVQSEIKARVSLDISDDRAIELRDAVVVALSAGRAWLEAAPEVKRATAGEMLRAFVHVVDVSLQTAVELDAVKPETVSEIMRFSTEATALVEAIGSADLSSVFTLTVTQLRRFKLPEGFDAAVRTLALGVELAAAKTPEEVEATIDAVAAPMGSYRRKFFGASRALTGLVGFGFGWEAVDYDKNNSANSAGPVGLVGLDVTWPIGGGQLVPGAFVSVLDLGAVFAKQDMETGSDPAPVSIEQVVALGIHARLGSRYLGPVVLHAGVSWVPNYRVVSGEEKDVLRVLVGASVDVTLWNF